MMAMALALVAAALVAAVHTGLLEESSGHAGLTGLVPVHGPCVQMR